MSIKSFESFNEKKSSNWIKDAIKSPGSLRKSMGKKQGEKISNSEIDSELQALKYKDKDKYKSGIQGLNKKDLRKFRQLNLAKTLKGLKETHEVESQNYMFFANLENICRMVSEMLEMDESELDSMLSDGHDWANDHISKSMEQISHVYNFLQSSMNGDDPQIPMDDGEITHNNIKPFDDFN
jgi:hypothetical protein